MPNPRTLSAYFSRQELWYHSLMMPILFPLGNYFFIGPRYFSDSQIFIKGTLLVFVLYWLSIATLTIAIRLVIFRFPTMQQTVIRTTVMLVVVGLLTVGLAVLDVYSFHLFPLFQTPFDWPTIRSILILGLIFDVCLCTVLNVFYTYSKWQENQTESEQLKRLAVQTQLDTLKSQVNPHFLFNCLNSLSSLISEDPFLAERFVDEMSKVYRYMLQANHRDMSTLEAEIRFVDSYAFLLQTRYGKGISIRIQVDGSLTGRYLPPLSLQTLVENALKHNSVSVEKPLQIDIRTTTDGTLTVQNTIQKRVVRVQTSQVGLSNLTTKYEMIGIDNVAVYDDGQHFTVRLPLLSQQTPEKLP